MKNLDIHRPLGLRRVINANGTMTYLGASSVVPAAIEAMCAILPEFVEMDALQAKASRAIATACGSEAGFVTSSCASGIVLAVAAAMTGPDLAAIERLPNAGGLKNEVLILAGHQIHYGAPIEQAIALAGARAVPVGQSTFARRHQLEGAIGARTACALYVVSHHAAQYGMLPLDEFAAVCHARGVPVIVDAASEYDLRGFLAQGADVVLYSAQKFLGGPTAGIVAGPKALIRSAYLQNLGIGRCMKVGKEGIAGTIAALQAWATRDHAAVRQRETEHLALWQSALEQRPGVSTAIEPDPTGNPLDRLKLTVDPAKALITAWDLADALERGEPAVSVRDHEVEHGYFFLDPCNLRGDQAQVVARRLNEELERALLAPAIIATSLEQRRQRRFDALSRWPD
ncbi:aminotransferase class V-fold PLP-dependent enzyme [Verminephrobacter aporrectodeae subsp. tuberculatae]|uniref:aminotransferase class V-fold PLP-dependent enzyme n=1 Tax=Verminephrobacter aporrectodeae TaxID=1110389 RepID=UPI00224324AC|nr:PLP-dependent transferase [Verminephrobacter aporrectodeae]MCW8205834.1 aminotransferase class V-fold PLP-dependent enzyme [Verminephrobacter aporrectodeae subsp. tuberculatae]